MKADEIRQLPEEEIRSEVEKRRSEIFRLRLRAGSDDVESPGALRRMRREIARLLTILREREGVQKDG
jgi:large subunit ribosomal protein L29